MRLRTVFIIICIFLIFYFGVYFFNIFIDNVNKDFNEKILEYRKKMVISLEFDKKNIFLIKILAAIFIIVIIAIIITTIIFIIYDNDHRNDLHLDKFENLELQINELKEKNDNDRNEDPAPHTLQEIQEGEKIVENKDQNQKPVKYFNINNIDEYEEDDDEKESEK